MNVHSLQEVKMEWCFYKLGQLQHSYGQTFCFHSFHIKCYLSALSLPQISSPSNVNSKMLYNLHAGFFFSFFSDIKVLLGIGTCIGKT